MERPIEIGTRLERHPRVVFRELGDGKGGVLLHLITGQYYALNGAGALVWNLVNGQRTVAEIVDEVLAQMENTPAAVPEDVMRFVRQLQQRGLIEVLMASAQAAEPAKHEAGTGTP